MKQLRPKTILAIGLPCSLLFNLFVSMLFFYFVRATLENWLVVGFALGMSAWLFGSIPIFGAVALIRYRIGKFDVKRHQIKEAKICCGRTFVATVTAVIAAALFSSLFFVDPVILGVGYVWVVWFGVTLILIIGINIVIRLFSKGQVA